MKKEAWRRKIVEATKEVGTYRPSFEMVINTLAEILERRDDALEKFYESGGDTVVVHINTRGGGENLVKNPALAVVDDMDKTALTYWRDLGLTPAGLKRINDSTMKRGSKKASLGDVLKDIGI